MKKPAIFLSFALACGGAAAQGVSPADPFLRQAPAQTSPTLRGVTSAPQSAPSSGLNLTGVQNVTFGNPRTSNSGSQTRVVFDLAPGVTYTLMPTFTGLRIDVQGARVLPAVTAALGGSVSEYRAGGGQATVFTPFPLSFTDGWRASEATLATGSRVLILEFGAVITGGASESLRALVRNSAPPASATTAEANAVLNAPLGLKAAVPAPVVAPTAAAAVTPSRTAQTPSPAAPTAAAPIAPPTTSAVNPDQLPPGDMVQPSKQFAPAPALPDANAARPSALTGRVTGQAQPGALLTAPRIGKNPGLTRVVLDLPPGSTYTIQPTALGLRIALTGLSVMPQSGQNVSPEVRTWRFEPTNEGVEITLVTATPTTARSGWRAQLLPPTSGSDRARLALDLSPALANLTPLAPAERLIASVPPVLATRGTAILALSANYVQPRVVLDPGHGGRDPGAVGSVIEKEVTLSVALRVRDLLRAAGVDVVLTRDTDRALNSVKNTDLQMRAQMGSPGTQLFVSIHVNAMEANAALRGYGVETWWNPNHPMSSTLASMLQRQMVSITGAFSRGLKSNQSLSVLRNSRIPAALVEIGYASHPVDGLNLQDANYLERVAVGIAQGIREALTSGVTAGNAVGGGGK
ncbi:N-acetylmuramoyl-L-alanine amidase family protein [Deinococcus puniceus]|uniref:N-acetylmuramoyl-L-alanine amidase n=1 Tax=Deinococcus puniceus TaxID=1182568 RepID=A0A172T6Q0_9DEIO|nr:N-acetylmuramoyl-L-alanine amidase [Deinococcus puniceus]ANE42627.1 N-acetylmuramoyl-L-alanine amidase [Deinococcus puniceus]